MEIKKINGRTQTSHEVHHPVHVSGLDLPAIIKYGDGYINLLEQEIEKSEYL